MQGDRVGLCVTQLDPALMERGLAAAPGTVPTFNAAVASVEKIRYALNTLPCFIIVQYLTGPPSHPLRRFFAGVVTTGSKFHVNVGHDTVMAELVAFGLPDGA